MKISRGGFGDVKWLIEFTNYEFAAFLIRLVFSSFIFYVKIYWRSLFFESLDTSFESCK